MNRGLYIGGTSLVNNQRKMDVLSNNLANINTTGYKKDFSVSESFPELLLAKRSRINERPTRLEADNLDYVNRNDQHIAKVKEGYFRLETPDGISHVKEINLIVDDEGFLKTKYKNLDDEYKTNYENYLLDNQGNRIQNPGNIEEVLTNNVYQAPGFVVGTMSAGVKFKSVFTDFTQGGVMDTGGKFDLALNGDGFFKLGGKPASDEEGTFYTRSGSFAVNNGILTDLDGRPVLGQGGEIAIDGVNFDVLGDGTILVDDIEVAKLDIVNIDNKEYLRKVGDNKYAMAYLNPGRPNEEQIPAEESDFTGNVLQGHLETSNMNAITGMVEMISLMRDYEANQKVVKTQDEILEKATTELGRI